MALIMVKGIGIDSIEIARFRLWHTYSYRQLSRIFSSEEIDYCLSNIIKSSERFAVRFAAKEAFFLNTLHKSQYTSYKSGHSTTYH